MPGVVLSRRRKLTFAAIVTASFFLFAEALLRLIGFHASSRVESLAFTFPMDDYNRSSPEPILERDSLLFWKPRPGCCRAQFAGMLRTGVFTPAGDRRVPHRVPGRFVYSLRPRPISVGSSIGAGRGSSRSL